METESNPQRALEREIAAELTALRVRGIWSMDSHKSGQLEIPQLRTIAARMAIHQEASREDLRALIEKASENLEPETAEVVRLSFGLDDGSLAGRAPSSLLEAVHELQAFAHMSGRSRDRLRNAIMSELAVEIASLVSRFVSAAEYDFVDGGIKRRYLSELSEYGLREFRLLRAQVVALYLAAERWHAVPRWRIGNRVRYITFLVAQLVIVERLVFLMLDEPFAPPRIVVRTLSNLFGERRLSRRGLRRLRYLAERAPHTRKLDYLCQRLWWEHPLLMLRLYRQLTPRRPIRPAAVGGKPEDQRVSLIWFVYKWAAQFEAGTSSKPSQDLTQKFADILFMRERGAPRRWTLWTDDDDFRLRSLPEPTRDQPVILPATDDQELAWTINLLWVENFQNWLDSWSRRAREVEGQADGGEADVVASPSESEPETESGPESET